MSKTHDLDSDADLWRGNSFFSGRSARYLCLSKTEGISDYIVDSIGVIGEKDIPPDGYCLISKTLDTGAFIFETFFYGIIRLLGFLHFQFVECE